MRVGDLEALAAELGIDVVGAAPAAAYEATERHILERKARGLFADMKFTMARPEESCHPETLLAGARTVVAAALCYWLPEPERPAGHGRLPRYAWFDAYAELREKLDELGRRLGGSYRVLVDANQHVDREGAARSGVGFYGKNTMLITRRFGSWVVLGTLITDVALEPTPPLDADCGECRLCIDACPTGALDEPGTLDATRCLSYWTQSEHDMPREYEAKLGPQVYGCDICQDVCPWNRGIEKRRAGESLPVGATPH
ncbi:MAG: tRNA epoxyqueuosine(34) reductase QueG, partial [Actinobacteria bacterium]|nr:tRNA epoxyqueuosine(34) reductase QueG [Actinomycetota bacterium]